MVLNPTHQALLDELGVEDKAMVETNDALRIAQVRWQIASRRYVAVRDLVIERLGASPYIDPMRWRVNFASQGRFRFYLMAPGDAVTAALTERQEPTTLQELMETLTSGGNMLPLRSINAALMQTKGIEKTADDKYLYVQPEEAF
jgi:hypothetical protein